MGQLAARINTSVGAIIHDAPTDVAALDGLNWLVASQVQRGAEVFHCDVNFAVTAATGSDGWLQGCSE